MLEEILHSGVVLANQRARLILWDVLWKFIWLVCTAVGVLLLMTWFGSQLRGLAWEDTGMRPLNALIAAGLARELWQAYRSEVLLAVGGLILFSGLLWFLLEAYVRRKFVGADSPLPPGEGRADAFFASARVRAGKSNVESGPHPALPYASPYRARAPLGHPLPEGEGSFSTFSVFFLSNVAKSAILITTAGLLLPVALHGAILLALIIFLCAAFCLALVETLIRTSAVHLAGTDLIRVTSLLGILMSLELTIAASLGLLLIAGFLNVARLTDALVMLGVTGTVAVFLTILHSYLLLVRFSTIVIMRQNAVEV